MHTTVFYVHLLRECEQETNKNDQLLPADFFALFIRFRYHRSSFACNNFDKKKCETTKRNWLIRNETEISEKRNTHSSTWPREIHRKCVLFCCCAELVSERCEILTNERRSKQRVKWNKMRLQNNYIETMAKKCICVWVCLFLIYFIKKSRCSHCRTINLLRLEAENQYKCI